MAPKKKNNADQEADKAAKKKKEASAADKTFGLKNKNKSKVVQQQIKQIQSSAKGSSQVRQENAERDEKKNAAKKNEQSALLAGLFNMATDRKGRAFDPLAKKKAKEKNNEDEKSGLSVDPEHQQLLVDGIKNAIRLANPLKGTNVSSIGGSVYVKSIVDDKKLAKVFANVTVLAFVRRRVNDFWIAEDEIEAQATNPTVRCKEDVDAQEAEDDRAVFLILEEKRQEFVSDSSLPRCTMKDLKSWWKKSAALEHMRDPETGLVDYALENKKLKKKLTGEELFKLDPTMFTTNSDGTAVKTGEHNPDDDLAHAFKALQPRKEAQKTDDSNKENEKNGTNNSDDSDSDDEDKEEFKAGMEWGALDNSDDEGDHDNSNHNKSKAGASSKPISGAASSSANPKKMVKGQPLKVNEKLFAAEDELPDDLDD